MLTYESLTEQAKLRGMPQTKIRGILREYLQVLILKELCGLKEGRKLSFTGGTYLRLIHGLKRFSEDLDFNSNSAKKAEFETLLNKIKSGLGKSGLECGLSFSHWGQSYVAKLIFPGIEKTYNAVSKYSKKEGIIIKVEAASREYKASPEALLISGFGEFYPCVCAVKGVLFADKIDALGKKQRGRHIYDVIFMLANNYPVDMKALKVLGIKDEPKKAIRERISRFSKDELKKQAEVLRPFLFDEKEADLIANAGNIIPQLLEKYGAEKPLLEPPIKQKE
ncbi:MAG: nucleotidyl transferase AbiEii/AbiGii toxin family protein [Candidatus Omnitrophica bacterium]|nr:nucleotidyl transferase AbiEii/AbiGii toxin family protein [Candidatus Omnitrophota bacterium]